MKFIEKLNEIYRYRHMLYTLVKQDIRGRYKGSFLGLLWTLLNPLLMLLVYSVVFQFVFRNNIENYPIYLFICLMPWNCFQSSIFMGTSCISNNAGILKKVYFPREILPLATIISNVINYLFSVVIIFIALLVSGVGISWSALMLPVILLIQSMFTFGLVLILSGINVYVRDVQYMMNPIMMIWMYATPVLYSVSMVPEKFRSLYMLNPMTRIMLAYQSILYDKVMPNIADLGIVALEAIFMLVVGYLAFSKLQRRFAEEV